MTYEEIPAERVLSFWEGFGRAVGVENLRKAYGDYWPRGPVYGEKVWAVWGEGGVIGWVSLRPDPVEPIVWMALGVWPRYNKMGNSKAIFKWSIGRAFYLYPNAQAMFWAVNNDNLDLLNYNKGTSPVVGGIHFPQPGFTYFAVKNKYRGGSDGGSKV
jgi:hypothetical protein